MANYNTLMSAAIRANPDDLKALKDVFDLFIDHGDELETWIDQEFLDAGMSLSLERTELFKSIATDSGGAIGVAATIETDGDDTYLWIRSDESVDVDAVARILQDWLAETKSDLAVQIEWADTCSRLRVDGFGGGAAHITRHGIEWCSTRQFLQEKLREMAPAPAAEDETPGLG